MDSDYIVANDDGSTTVLLKYALKSKNDNIADITEITLHRPTVGDLEAGDSAKGDMGKIVKLVQSLSGLPGAMVRKIDVEDFNRISSVLNNEDAGKKHLETGED